MINAFWWLITVVLVYNIYEMEFSELDIFVLKILWMFIMVAILYILVGLWMRIEIKYRKDKLELEQRELSLKKK